MGGDVALLELERAEFEAVLGTTVELATSDPGDGARWVLVLDAMHEGPPTLGYDPDARLLVSRAADVADLFGSMSLFRAVMRAGGGTLAAAECVTVGDAIERVVDEVADTYPSFELRGLDWEAVCARHLDAVRTAGEPLAAFQRWLAELEDGHTWVWPSVGHLPYAVRVAKAPVFVRVPSGTRGHEVGVRPGWRLATIDGEAVDADGWLARTAAPAHARALVAGRRLLAGPVGTPRTFTAVSPSGETTNWAEATLPAPEGELVTWRRLGSGTGYVRLGGWIVDRGVEDALDAAFAELRPANVLVLDLQGNPGGNLVLACRTRDRFLRGPTLLGSVRYSVGGGELSPPFPISGEPPAPERRWPGRLVVLTDPLTFSASEDFLLGLQGLEHVRVVGRRSGGGSGRPVSLPLFSGWTLTISTALTYDRVGHCVEGAGIPVDVEVEGSDEEVLAAAEALAR